MAPTTNVSEPARGSSGRNLLLAVDAGGTKTAAWLADLSRDESEQVLGRGRAAAGNPLSVGFPEAIKAITSAAAEARQSAKLGDATIDRAILSIAGSANEELRDKLVAALRDARLASSVAVVSDVLPILAAGTPDCCGVAVIAGTGSVAFARAPDGRTFLSGGWGYLLGDEGSGYFIGRAALRLALTELETGVTRQPLTEAVLKQVGAESKTVVTKQIYRSADPRSAVAAIAPVVIAAADSDDATAQSIIDSAAQELAALVRRAVDVLNIVETPFPLAVAGGVLVHSRRLFNQLRVELRRIGIAADAIEVEEPLAGCVRLAALEHDALLDWHRL